MARRKIGRNELIEKAGYLFRTRGYANTSIADIADACGLSKASIYHHIASKQELATKVIAQLHQDLKSKIFDLAYDTDKNINERSVQLINATVDFFKDRDGGCLMGNFVSELVDTHPEFRDLFTSFFNEWIAAFTDLLTNYYTKEESQIIAQDFIAQLQGAILLSRLYKNNEALNRACKEILAVLTNASPEHMAVKKAKAVTEEAMLR